jgi:hypothetical protein
MKLTFSCTWESPLSMLSTLKWEHIYMLPVVCYELMMSEWMHILRCIMKWTTLCCDILVLQHLLLKKRESGPVVLPPWPLILVQSVSASRRVALPPTPPRASLRSCCFLVRSMHSWCLLVCFVSGTNSIHTHLSCLFWTLSRAAASHRPNLNIPLTPSPLARPSRLCGSGELMPSCSVLRWVYASRKSLKLC